MIETWSEENRPDYQKVLQDREAAMERGRKRRQLEEEALRWQREEERKALWDGFDAEALLTDALGPAEGTRERCLQGTARGDPDRVRGVKS